MQGRGEDLLQEVRSWETGTMCGWSSISWVRPLSHIMETGVVDLMRVPEAWAFSVRAGLLWLLAQSRGRLWEANCDSRRESSVCSGNESSSWNSAQRLSCDLRKHSYLVWEWSWTQWHQPPKWDRDP